MIWRWWREVIDVLAEPVRFWRRSLLTRTVSLTAILSGLAVTAIGGYMSLTIESSLFSSRLDQVVTESVRTSSQIQALFDNSVTPAGTIDVETANSSAQTVIRINQSVPGAGGFAILRTPGQITQQTMTSSSTSGLDLAVLTPGLRQAVVQAPDQLHHQSVALPTDDGFVPGVAVGSVIGVPTAGSYELYLIYDFSDVQATLNLIQQTLIVGSILLVFTIALVTWIVVRLAIGPVKRAADTAERFARGYLEERLPERGEDVIATLARSFNEMAESIQNQIVRLGKLSRLQQRFVSDVSHELRTPLTTIRLAADVLNERSDQLQPEAARSLELLLTQIERFESMLTDLLEISRYDAGAVQLDHDLVNVVEIVQDCLDQLAPLAEQKGSALLLEVYGGYGDVEADSRRLRRIVLNFLGNAIDHGESKPIVTFVDSDEATVSIAVRDWGVGMDEQEVARVFDRFWRADPSRQRTTGGTGLGLAIAHEDAIAHGGRIDVWSEPGKGTCFLVTLPRVAGALAGNSSLPLPPQTELVDDEGSVRVEGGVTEVTS